MGKLHTIGSVEIDPAVFAGAAVGRHGSSVTWEGREGAPARDDSGIRALTPEMAEDRASRLHESLHDRECHDCGLMKILSYSNGLRSFSIP